MKIGIEAQRIFRKRKHGMDYVVLEELKMLQKIDTVNEYVVFVKPGEDRCLQSTPRMTVVELNCPSYPLWEQWALPRAVKQWAVDLLHCTSNTAPIFCRVPLILTLHDIIFLEKRDKGNKSLYQNLGWFYRRWVVPAILDKCRYIITVSDFERDNILRKLHLDPQRVVRIYNGYNTWFDEREENVEIVNRYSQGKEYFFFFGNTDPKKNTERTLLAYAHYLQQSKKKRSLLLADFSESRLSQLLSKHHIEDIRPYILLNDYIENRHLPFIYRSAFAVLYTSLRESFGIPLLEAMASGTPVITSNTSSMPEIGGDQAALVDPCCVEAITTMMLRLETDDDYYALQRQWGLDRARLFSWKKTTEELLLIYQQAYNMIHK